MKTKSTPADRHAYFRLIAISTTTILLTIAVRDREWFGLVVSALLLVVLLITAYEDRAHRLAAENARKEATEWPADHDLYDLDDRFWPVDEDEPIDLWPADVTVPDDARELAP